MLVMRRVSLSCCGLVILFRGWLPSANAANLKTETLQAWEEYIQIASARLQSRQSADRPFLWIDEAKDRASKVQKREIVISSVGPHTPKKIPSGLIHDWMGGAFLPDVTLDDALSILRQYGRYKDIYHPNVVDSRVVSRGDSEDQFAMTLMNKGLFQKTAIDSEVHISYVRVNERRLYSISQMIRIREIAEFGSPAQHALPEDEGTGLLWRLYSVTRFEQRDGGLYIEVEAIALSRDIPAALRFVADPIVRRVSRESIATALRQTESAVRSAAVARTSGAITPATSLKTQ